MHISTQVTCFGKDACRVLRKMTVAELCLINFGIQTLAALVLCLPQKGMRERWENRQGASGDCTLSTCS
jgi:hypothetical protein